MCCGAAAAAASCLSGSDLPLEAGMPEKSAISSSVRPCSRLSSSSRIRFKPVPLHKIVERCQQIDKPCLEAVPHPMSGILYTR